MIALVTCIPNARAPKINLSSLQIVSSTASVRRKTSGGLFKGVVVVISIATGRTSDSRSGENAPSHTIYMVTSTNPKTSVRPLPPADSPHPIVGSPEMGVEAGDSWRITADVKSHAASCHGCPRESFRCIQHLKFLDNECRLQIL
jgi:hypothetical protein